MTPELLDFVRNLYGASGGAVPGPAWMAALASVLWLTAYQDGETALLQEEDETSADFLPEGASRYEDSYDALDWMMKNRR